MSVERLSNGYIVKDIDTTALGTVLTAVAAAAAMFAAFVDAVVIAVVMAAVTDAMNGCIRPANAAVEESAAAHQDASKIGRAS